MKRYSDIKLIKLYLWVAIGYLLLGILTMLGDYPGRFFYVVVNNVWADIYVTSINFILFEYTIPFVLKKRNIIVTNILLGILFLFIHLMLYSYGSFVWRSLGIAIHIYSPLKIYASIDDALKNQMMYSTGSVFFFGVSRHIYNYINYRNAAQQLQIEKQVAELNYLRSQTNPHFLFNTLNNIYSLARAKSDNAPESILRLSKILRFMLYEAGSENITIEQELTIISDYIALEELRYDDSFKINFNHDIENMKQVIPPLLLIALVENAFKHGVSETRGPTFIDINLSIKNNKLEFEVKNPSESSGEEDIKENIGLSNIRRQLELLYNDYSLSVLRDESVFTATLKINLSSHV